MADNQNSTVTPSASTAKTSFNFPIVINPDGSVTRSFQSPTKPPSMDSNSPCGVLSRDLPLNPERGTWIRLYLPREALDRNRAGKLPLIIYFHGGGFVLFSAASTIIHDFCVEIAAEVGLVVASVEYRLAPEHRLPAAYDDAVEALHWVATCSNDWLREYADLSSCFLAGGSAGGNIAYHAVVRAAAERISPVKIKGLVLQQPYFGGSERTSSEIRLAQDEWFPISINDHMWELSLPEGADRDHEYANPMAKLRSEHADQMRQLGLKVMVTGCDGDPMIDRQMELAKVLEEKGVPLMALFDEGGYHGATFREPALFNAFLANFKNFVLQ